MSIQILLTNTEQGLIYSLVALGLYISYRTLDIADLTTDGSFTLGIACSAILTSLGHPVLGLAAALIAGALAGGVTAVLQTKLGVQPILAGIITMTGLYSINLMIMGKSNLTLLRVDTLFRWADGLMPYGTLVLALVFAVVCAVLLVLFLRTQLGLSLRATGDNRDMVAASSINPAFTTTVGLCIANALIAVSGGLLAQQQGYGDLTLGTGMVVIGLASLIIGETLFRRGGVGKKAVGALVGSIIYRFVIAVALRLDLPSECLKLISAVIVALAIAGPYVSRRLAEDRRRRAARQKGDR